VFGSQSTSPPIFKRRFPESDNTYFVKVVTDIHLHPLDGEGNTKYLRIFAFLAVFVLGISCINFMNPATARAGNRAKEIGLRKVAGPAGSTSSDNFSANPFSCLSSPSWPRPGFL